MDRTARRGAVTNSVSAARRNNNVEAPPAPPLPADVRQRSCCSRLYLIIAAFIMAALCIGGGYVYQNQGTLGTTTKADLINWIEGDFSCTKEVERSVPVLRKAYTGSMRRVLHVGPDTCSVVYKLLKSDHEIEAWGIEPNGIKDGDISYVCKKMVRTGIVREADIKIPLPFRAQAFSLVIVSDALDYLSPRYLNRTIPDLARVSTDGLVIFTGYPLHQKVKVPDQKPGYGRLKLRNEMWWFRYFVQMRFEENETAIKKFDRAADKMSYRPGCQIYHLKPQRL